MRRTRAFLFGLVLALPFGTARLSAAPRDEEQTQESVEVRVSAVLEAELTLDKGLNAGLTVGSVVTFVRETGEQRRALIRRVSLASSTAELIGPPGGIEVGARGEVRLTSSGVEHPPWTRPEEQFDAATQPLLAPATYTPGRERDPVWTGRLWGFVEETREGGGAPDHGVQRLGFDLRGQNPFGRGGQLRLDARITGRTFDGEGGALGEGTDVQLERASYAFGGTRDESRRWEFGRFISREFPELGLLDGAELTQRLASGDRVGARLGYLPRLSADRETGEDLATAVYYRHVRGENEELQLGTAFQKTWHAGQADRDMFVGALDWAPARWVRAWAGAVVDLYGSEDTVKDGTELTELRAGVTWLSKGGDGAALSAFRVRWPELLRDEVSPVLQSTIADLTVDRVSLNGWSALTENWRLSGRVDRWGDQDDSGGGYQLKLAARDLLFDQGEVWVSAQADEGKFSDVTALRFGVYQTTGVGTWRASMDLARHELHTGGTSDQQVLRLGWDKDIGRAWQVSLTADAWFGDDTDATALGIWFARRF